MNKKRMLALTALCASLAAASFYLHYLPPVHKPKKKYRYAILLGCPAHDDGTMSRSQIARCKLALDTWIHYDNLIITGGAVKNEYPEAQVMADYIRARNDLIPVRTETRARNTWENMLNVRDMIGDGPVLLLTSDIHAARAAAMARQIFEDAAVLTYRDRRLKHRLREFYSRALYISLELKKRVNARKQRPVL